ncbi:MAG: hypothetical protein UHN59_01050, partial [Bacteroidales bacterium]|nr:hypothetical protein [Bacteroidales bacterium]
TLERGNFVSGKMNGNWEVFYPDGIRKTQTTYKDDLKNGVEILYDENGDIYQKAFYSEGVLNGLWEKYLNGTLVEKGIYHMGKKDGKWIFYAANGYKQREQEFSEGKPDGKWVEYYSTDKKSAEGEYKNGIKNGTWKNYDRSGKVLSSTTFSDGKKIKESVNK